MEKLGVPHWVHGGWIRFVPHSVCLCWAGIPPCGQFEWGKKRRGFMLEIPPMRTSTSSIDPATITSLPDINQGPLGKWGASGHPSQAVIV